MTLAQKLTWRVIVAKEPSKWGRRSTEEEKEEMKKTKHTPGRKKKKGRSQHLDKYSEELRKNLGGGKRCGDSYIAKEDECHQDEDETPGNDKSKKIADPPKKPRTKKGVPHGKIPKTVQQPGTPPERFQKAGAPAYVVSPKGGNGVLQDSGYLADGTDGIYEMDASQRPHRIYFPKIVDQAAAQYVSSAIADLMGLATHDDYLFKNEPTDQVAAGHEVIPFNELDEWQLVKMSKSLPDIAGWFIHTVLVRHEEVVGHHFDNMVLLSNKRPSVLHFGGTLLWTQVGGRKPDGMSPEALPELQNLRNMEYHWQTATVFGNLGEKEIISAISDYLSIVDEKDILNIIDAAQFAPDDRIEIGKGLISRKRVLEDMQGNHNGL